MPHFIQTPDAKQDILDIWQHIANDNFAAADRWLESINERRQMLAEYPRLGSVRRVKGMRFRTFAVRNYLIFF
ncbi:MAG: type II toxin-antitoxin system RelE/ParE family toxin [Phycisphaeraceae bacterium]